MPAGPRRILGIGSLNDAAPAERTDGRTPVRALSALYAALFFELGINLPFFPVWLRSQSLSDAAIGLIVAVPLYVRIVANPLVSALADRHGRLGDVLSVCAIIVAGGTALLADGLFAILIVVVVIALAQGPLIALTDAFTLAMLARPPARPDRYGGIRLWGSIAFAAANLAAGVLLVWLPSAAILWFLIGASLAVVVAAAMVARGGRSVRRHPVAAATPPGRSDLRRIVLVVAGAALIQASHGLFYSFSALEWQRDGLSSATIGALWAIGVAAEVCFFALLGRLIAAGVGPGVLLLLGGSVAVVRWAGMALSPGVVALVFLQTGNAFTFGATHAGSVLLLSELAPRHARAQVQGWLAAAWAGSMATLIWISGTLVPIWAERTYALMAAVAAPSATACWSSGASARCTARRSGATSSRVRCRASVRRARRARSTR